MKKLLIAALCFCATLSSQTFSGYRRAVDFAYGDTINPLRLAFPTSIGASVQVVLQHGTIVLSTGEVVFPLTTNTPITIGTGGGAETITPSAVVCITPSLLNTCTFTASLTKTHAST